MKILLAYIKRWFYLLFYGMWKGECGFHYKLGNKIIQIGTIKGSLKDKDGQITRIFYDRIRFFK